MSSFTAEQQFNLFAQLVEYIVRDTSVKHGWKLGEKLLSMLREFDLYLWTAEKMQRARQYIIESGDRNLYALPPDIFPCIMVTPGAVTIIEEYLPTEKGIVLRYLCCSGASGEVVNTGAISAQIVAYGISIIPLNATRKKVFVTLDRKFFLSERFADKTYALTAGGDLESPEMIVEEIIDEELRNTLCQACYVTKPRQTLVVASTKATDKRKKKGYSRGIAPRAQDREVHVVLDPDELRIIKRQATESQGGTHASPIPHKRRPHQRTFRADRYKKAKGKTVQFGEIYVKCKPGEKIFLPRKVYHVKRVANE